MIDLILDTESFEQKCVILKGLFRSDRLKQKIVTIGIDQYLSKSAMYGHIFLKTIKILYISAGKIYDQRKYKAIIEAAMVSTPDIFTDSSPMSPGPPMIVKKTSARKSLHLFIEVLDIKNKNSVLWL